MWNPFKKTDEVSYAHCWHKQSEGIHICCNCGLTHESKLIPRPDHGKYAPREIYNYWPFDEICPSGKPRKAHREGYRSLGMPR